MARAWGFLASAGVHGAVIAGAAWLTLPRPHIEVVLPDPPVLHFSPAPGKASGDHAKAQGPRPPAHRRRLQRFTSAAPAPAPEPAPAAVEAEDEPPEAEEEGDGPPGG